MSQRKGNVVTFFDEIASEYGRQYDAADSMAQFPLDGVRKEKAVQMLRQFKPSGKVLDIGCGPGRLVLDLVNLGYDVTGMDISNGMVREAEQYVSRNVQPNSPPATFRVGDIEALDIPSGSCDAVVVLGVLEYLEDDAVAFAEISRVLRSGGIAVVAFRNRLFNLGSLNKYTEREVETGSYTKLLDQFHHEMEAAQGKDSIGLPLAQFAGELRALAATWKEQSEEGPALGLTPSPFQFDMRQHTPQEARALGEHHGMQCKVLRYLHFHPFPPAIEQAKPTVFNVLGLAMEKLDDTPIGCVMASVFMTVFQS